jgi:valyl-tRNA synthetase
MSKSKGNVIDPVIMSDKYGTDSFRFTLAAFAAQGRDIKFSEERVEGYRHFVNKLWNASRFITMNHDGELLSEAISLESLELPERWILSRLSMTAGEIDRSLSEFRFNDAANAIYHFIWHELCDWYIEISKPVLYGEKNERREKTVRCLVSVLEKTLRLLHPFMPFVTEEIWQSLPGEKGLSIMREEYPDDLPQDREAENLMSHVMDAVTNIRSIRGELNISPSAEIEAHIKTRIDSVNEILLQNEFIVAKLARVKALFIGKNVKKPKGAAAAIIPVMEIYVPIKGLLDIGAEQARLKKELDKVNETILFLDKKLLNEDFLNSAPPDIVGKEKKRYDESIEKRQKITDQMERLKALDERDG